MSLKLAAYNPRLVFRSTTSRALALLALLVVVLYADILFAGRGFYLLDVISYHVPMKWIVRNVLMHGELPLWNHFYSAGQPLAANPAYEVFYPPQWLIFLPSFHFGFQLHIVVHFVIAAWGMFLLLRALGARALAAGFGAATFVVCGPYLSLATKLPLLFSLSWMPLALYCARKAIVGRKRRDVAVAALVLAMQLIIGEPTMAMQTWAIIGGYALWRRGEIKKNLTTVVMVGVAAALVAAIQLVPALDFTRDSVRSEPFEFRVVSNWSMPLERPMEMFLPSLFRNVTNEAGAPAITTMYPFRSDAFVAEMYLGLFVALIAVAGVLAASRGAAAVVTAVVLSIVVAAGDHTPLLKILYELHLFRSIRYPEKFILTAAFALIVWAALLFDRMLAGDRKLVRVAIVVASIWLAIMAVVAVTNGRYFGWQLLRAAVVVTLLAQIRRGAVPLIIVALTIADLAWATRAQVPRMPRAYFDPPAAVSQIPVKLPRIFPESYWQAFDQDPAALQWIANRSPEQYWWLIRNMLYDHLPARWDRALVMEDDVDRTALKTTDALLEAMKTARARHAIAAEQPFLKIAGASLRFRFGSSAPLEIVRESYPRCAFADRVVRFTSLEQMLDLQRGMETVAVADIEPFTPARGLIHFVGESANATRIGLRADGRAFLVISTTAHRYWSATIDGKPAPLLLTNGAYQGIVVPAGEHVIETRYRNPMIWIGAVITLLALIGLAVIARA
jgi:hypothetical protein